MGKRLLGQVSVQRDGHAPTSIIGRQFGIEIGFTIHKKRQLVGRGGRPFHPQRAACARLFGSPRRLTPFQGFAQWPKVIFQRNGLEKGAAGPSRILRGGRPLADCRKKRGRCMSIVHDLTLAWAADSFRQEAYSAAGFISKPWSSWSAGITGYSPEKQASQYCGTFRIAALCFAHRAVKTVKRDELEAVHVEVVAHFIFGHGRSEEFFALWCVNAIKAGPSRWRACDPKVDFGSTCVEDHFLDLAAGGATNQRYRRPK
ncbi:hypothetical protein GQR58_028977 [Nymphon striatum]|nr:hypothetical protein GQR58_028977 [Nymphon striatum]